MSSWEIQNIKNIVKTPMHIGPAQGHSMKFQNPVRNKRKSQPLAQNLVHRPKKAFHSILLQILPSFDVNNTFFGTENFFRLICFL